MVVPTPSLEFALLSFVTQLLFLSLKQDSLQEQAKGKAGSRWRVLSIYGGEGTVDGEALSTAVEAFSMTCSYMPCQGGAREAETNRKQALLVFFKACPLCSICTI